MSNRRQCQILDDWMSSLGSSQRILLLYPRQDFLASILVRNLLLSGKTNGTIVVQHVLPANCIIICQLEIHTIARAQVVHRKILQSLVSVSLVINIEVVTAQDSEVFKERVNNKSPNCGQN